MPRSLQDDGKATTRPGVRKTQRGRPLIGTKPESNGNVRIQLLVHTLARVTLCMCI